VKSGLTRAKSEGWRIERPKFAIGRAAVLQDLTEGMSLDELVPKYQVSTAMIHKF